MKGPGMIRIEQGEITKLAVYESLVLYQGIPFNIRRRFTTNSRMEQIMDETDAYCRTHSERLSHAQVFNHAREVVNAGRRIHA